MTAPEQKILAKIRKVLALAEGTDNPAEAEIMMAKVQRMLDEHNFQLLDVERASDEDPIGTNHDAAHVWVKDAWAKHTYSALAQLYGAKITWIKIGKNKTAISISGRESARITWELMLPFVRKQIRVRAKALRLGTGWSDAKAQRQIGNALTLRILGMVAEARRADAKRVATGGRALVPVDMVDAEIASLWPEITEARNTEKKITVQGVKAAADISLHRQATGVKTKQIAS